MDAICLDIIIRHLTTASYLHTIRGWVA